MPRDRDLAAYIPALRRGADLRVDVDLGEINDSNGNEILEFDAVASAVNHVRLLNAATGNGPQIQVAGGDTNAALTIATKGTGGLTLDVDGTTTGTAVTISSTAVTTGVCVDVNGAGLTTGTGIDLSNLDAITTGKAIHIDATGITHTTGILVHIDSAGTVITGAGRLFLSDHTGATGTSATLNEFKTAANDESVLLLLSGASLTSGTLLNTTVAGITTGKGISIPDANALTSGIVLSIASSATAITGAGRLVYVNHTGATGTSAILNEFASAANDETTVLRVTASDVLAAGVLLDLSGTAVTTGTILDLGGLDALTTGTGINIVSNASGTGTRSLVQITNDNTAATGTTCLSIQNDATAGAHVKLTGTGILGVDFTALTSTDCLFDCTAGTGCTAAPQTNAAIGFLNIRVGGTQQWIPYYNAT